MGRLEAGKLGGWEVRKLGSEWKLEAEKGIGHRA